MGCQWAGRCCSLSCAVALPPVNPGEVDPQMNLSFANGSSIQPSGQSHLKKPISPTSPSASARVKQRIRKTPNDIFARAAVACIQRNHTTTLVQYLRY
eukprot:g20683.t1